MKKIILPALEIEISTKNCLPPLLFAAGGRKPDNDWFKETVEKNNATVWAVDKGVEICRAAAVVPVRLTGDNDSAEESAWHWAQKKRVETDVFDRAKDKTDFQLALELSKKSYGDNIIIATGCFGGRFDHQFSLLFSLAGDGRAAIAADEKETLLILHGGEKIDVKLKDSAICKVSSTLDPLLRGAKPQSGFGGCRRLSQPIISLLPFSKTCENVTITGVRWPLADATLTQKFPYAVSNELNEKSGGNFSASLGSGTLGVYIAAP